ncbi:uncharacterized protein LOC124406208 [Diprion similis]|uniref:uncharacterized protein LOC124406208 n=1 Tax=Diprion similis TaxID=362088 RepID=UPI001EF7C613|nr:uncharacterized protein LOC124406208 [Diprion similis]XP_046737521.1 uncharacterized protein LOC124406208 [Diprion similis]
MRIEALSAFLAVVWVTAVLCPWLVAANNLTSSFTSRRPRDHPFRGHISAWNVPLDETSNKRMTYREMQKMLRREAGDDGNPVDCCPTDAEMSEPLGGTNRDNMYVDLYRDGENKQRFYEYSCKKEVLDKPCRFIDRKLKSQSRCVQKFSYTYAIIKTLDHKGGLDEHRHHHGHQILAVPGTIAGGSGWALDYIKVRSGCSCEVSPKPKKQKASATKAKRARSKQRQPRDNDPDFEA